MAKKRKMYKIIRELKAKGLTNAEIVARTGNDPKTVRKYLAMDPERYERYLAETKERTKALEPFADEILAIYAANGNRKLIVSSVFDCLVEAHEVIPATERTLRNFVGYLVDTGRLVYTTAKRPYVATLDSEAGHQLQVDFGEWVCPSGLKLFIFSAVLSLSRYKFVAFQGRDFTAEDVIRHLLDAFEFFGGMPSELVIDQDSTMVCEESRGEVKFTAKFATFLDEMGLSVFVCRKADPESKGKIEAVIRFVKVNFLAARDFTAVEAANDGVRSWLRRRANGKLSAATRRIPLEVFEAEERPRLRSLRASIFAPGDSAPKEDRLVDTLGEVLVQGCKYPVPDEYRERPVDVTVTDHHVTVIDRQSGETVVAHDKAPVGTPRVHDKRRHARRQQRRDEAKAEVLSWHKSEAWRRFVEANFAKYGRYFREQSAHANKSLRTGVDEEVLERALRFCLERDTVGMNELVDTHRHYRWLEEAARKTEFVLPSPLAVERRHAVPVVAVRPVSAYASLLAGGEAGA